MGGRKEESFKTGSIRRQRIVRQTAAVHLPGSSICASVDDDSSMTLQSWSPIGSLHKDSDRCSRAFVYSPVAWGSSACARHPVTD